MANDKSLDAEDRGRGRLWPHQVFCSKRFCQRPQFCKKNVKADPLCHFPKDRHQRIVAVIQFDGQSANFLQCQQDYLSNHILEM